MSGAFCEKHGPYDADLGQCPYCAQERGLPRAPRPLDDDLETDPWGGRPGVRRAPQDEELTVPLDGAEFYAEELDEIDYWPRRRVADLDGDEEVTELLDRRRGDWDDEATVVERTETGLMGFLIVKDGLRRGQVHRIRNGTTLGRSGANVLIQDMKVSRRHARFTVEGGQFRIWDLGTERGTYVNDEQIREATPLRENDEIRVGGTTFVLKTLA